MKNIFGFGSLINLDSLRASAPEVKDLKTVYIKGFKRDFSLWDPLGFTKTFPEIQGIGFCALDVTRSSQESDKVNGVMFAVTDEAFEDIKMREKEYEILREVCYDFETDEALGECYFFSANKNNGEYNFGCKAQEKYLQVCLDGAKDLGDEFYKQFLETTYLGEQKLSEVI